MTDYYKDHEPYTPRPKYGPRFTADDVRCRAEVLVEPSMLTCKKMLMKEQILEDLNRGRNSHDTVLLYDILEYMVENNYV